MTEQAVAASSGAVLTSDAVEGAWAQEAGAALAMVVATVVATAEAMAILAWAAVATATAATEALAAMAAATVGPMGEVEWAGRLAA